MSIYTSPVQFSGVDIKIVSAAATGSRYVNPVDIIILRSSTQINTNSPLQGGFSSQQVDTRFSHIFFPVISNVQEEGYGQCHECCLRFSSVLVHTNVSDALQTGYFIQQQ